MKIDFINNRLIKGTLIKKIFYFLIFIVFVFMLCVSISPIQKINEFEKNVRLDSVWSKQYDSIYNQADIVPLIREKAYYEALLKLSEKDSIQLAVNLHDSIVGISFKGVILHTVKLKDVELDLLLKKLPNNIYAKIFSDPIKILSQNATIVKEPIVVRQAPKDTIEAALNAFQPDTLMQNPAFLHLHLDYGINLIFEQDLNLTKHDKWTQFKFLSRQKLSNFTNQVGRFFSFRKVEYCPSIVIKMPVDDLRATYRALPTNAYVVIYY